MAEHSGQAVAADKVLASGAILTVLFAAPASASDTAPTEGMAGDAFADTIARKQIV